jgi:ubiquinone/menaquinone biosynthesis C-methylase UbiE
VKEKKVINYYNSFSTNYNNIYQDIQIQKYNFAIGKDFEICEWILDHGGGTGMLSKWLDYPLVTFDISFSMIQNGKIDSNDFQGIVGDMNQMPFRKDTFKIIFSFTAIQNSSDINKSLNEILRTSEVESYQILTILTKKFNPDVIYHWLHNNHIDYQITNNLIEDVMISMNIGNK